MFKHFKKILKSEKGFTLVEILVVISIIAILFVTLLPQIDFAGDKARQTGVKTDFHTVQIAAESYLRESAGNGLTVKGLNSYLDKGMALITDGVATVGTGLHLTKKDPWGQEYDAFIYAGNKAIVIKSMGKNETTTVGTGSDADDFIYAAYYHNGVVTSCTNGFETNNVDSDLISKDNCGKFGIGTNKATAGTALATPIETP